MSDLLQVSSSPHVRDRVKTDYIMRMVLLALLPAAAWGIYLFGPRALMIICISVASCVITEWVFELGMKKKVTIYDGSAAVTGLLLAMNLPASAPWWLPLIGGVFAILIVKQLFGGLGQNFMNPALAARCFLLIAFTGRMTDFAVPESAWGRVADTVSGATPLQDMRMGGVPDVKALFLGNVTGTIGETSALLLLAGAIFLLIFKIIDLRIPLTYLGSFAIFLLIFGGRGFDLTYLAGQLFGGGLMLGAWFMATDYVTTPITKNGQLIYGVILGFLTGLFRVLGASAEGVSYAIIIGNLLVPLIERLTRPRAFGKEEKRMNKIIKDAAALTAITLAAGILLGGTYEITKEPIKRQQQLAKEEASRLVFEEAKSFQTAEEETAGHVNAAIEQEGYTVQHIDEIQEALDGSGNLLGYVFTVTTSEGYGGDLTFTLGVKEDGTLNGIHFLSISETAGLGMKAKEAEFSDQFKEKKAEQFSYTKKGAASDSEIDAISGATVTTNAVTNGVNAGLAAFRAVKEGA